MRSLSAEWSRYLRLLSSLRIRVIYCWGPPGVGKTYGALHYGRIERGFYAVTITTETSAADLCGHFIIKGNEVVWHDGPFTRAMREGKRLVINELANANADVLALLMPLLESWETARLTLHSGETVRPADGFHIIATDNQSPEQLPEALRDRFVACVFLSEPHPDALAGLCDDLREVAEAGLKIKDDRRISARGWTSLQLLMEEFGLEEGCLCAFGPDRGRMVYDAIRLALARKKA
jgi:MoxR-like ATPase